MSDSPVIRIPWKPIAPLRPEEAVTNGTFGSLDALRAEWKRRLEALEEDERTRIRQRTLRKLAIESGFIERLYDLEWGLTLTLVAEGLTREVIEREGGRVDDRVLATIRAQMDSLELVRDFVRAERALTVGFIKELHAAITRTQETYTATDALGRTFERPLVKGVWKIDPNHVVRQDNTLLEYTPPEQVGSEMDQLISFWGSLDETPAHPLVKAAWLHHRFVQIHPFADGNGRVARALTLLVLEKDRYAPLVVDRWHRTDYLRALDAANDGDLSPLVKLFAKLENAALTSELERPPEIPAGGLSRDVAHTLGDQIVALRQRRTSEVLQRLEVKAIAVHGRTTKWFEAKKDELLRIFRERGLTDIDVRVRSATPPSEEADWFHRQIIDSARRAGHYANFNLFTAWCGLLVCVEAMELRYVASIHGANREPGIMAVTTFGEIRPRSRGREKEPGSPATLITTTKDAFRFVHTETSDEIDRRSDELEGLLDEGLTEALSQFLARQ